MVHLPFTPELLTKYPSSLEWASDSRGPGPAWTFALGHSHPVLMTHSLLSAGLQPQTSELLQNPSRSSSPKVSVVGYPPPAKKDRGSQGSFLWRRQEQQAFCAHLSVGTGLVPAASAAPAPGVEPGIPQVFNRCVNERLACNKDLTSFDHQP